MRLVEKITRHPRYHPEEYELDYKMHWSSKIWVSNIFRAYEWLFGRGFGIRAEVSSTPDSVTLYTFEALLCFIEVEIREFFSQKLLPLKLYPIQLVPNPNYQNNPIKFPGIMLAIAFDAQAVGTTTTTSPLTYSHTCTGSNLILIVTPVMTSGLSNPTISTPTYNSISMTLAGSQQLFNSNVRKLGLYFLVNPSTGTNTVSVSFSGSFPNLNAASISWSGVNQSGQPDATAGLANQNTANPSLTVTTVADNCWVAGILGNSINTITAGLTDRENFLFSSLHADLQDTNGPKTPAGSQTVNWTMSSGNWGASAASFSPAGAAVTAFGSTLSLMGVG